MIFSKLVESYNAKITIIAGTMGSSFAQLWGLVPDSVGKVGVVLSVLLTVLVIQGQRKKNALSDIDLQIRAINLEAAQREAEQRRRKEDHDN